MALTTYSKLGALQNLNSEMSNFQQAELAGELLSYADNFDLPNTLLQPLYDPEGFLHPEDYSHLLPYFSPCDPLISLSEVLTTQLDFDPCLYPKRQRCYENEYCSDFAPTFVDGLIPNSCSVPAFLPDGLFSPMPEYCCPQVDCTQNVECLKKTDERVVSAQSIAARERRRKITEKTQELGKMIPGGTKMNTAEMLDAASKYVKYMQAQVGILELMGSFQETCEATSTKDLQIILASPAVQEKLYLEEKCLVPKELAQMLAKHRDIQSEPSISKVLNQVVTSEN